MNPKRFVTLPEEFFDGWEWGKKMLAIQVTWEEDPGLYTYKILCRSAWGLQLRGV